MKLDPIVQTLEGIAPPELAEPFDNGKIGLIYRGTPDVERVAVALDPTFDVIMKAKEMDAQLLITHHTLIWNPVNKIDGKLAMKLSLLLDNHMSLYSMHTNYDKAEGGVNDMFGKLLGLKNPVREGLHVRGEREKPCTPEMYSLILSRTFNVATCINGGNLKSIKVVGVAGSGFQTGIEAAVKYGCDTVVSSEVRHDLIRDAEDYGLTLIEVPHYYAESPAMNKLALQLQALGIDAIYIEDEPSFVKAQDNKYIIGETDV